MASVHSARETWPDVAKGIGIILVVIGHVWRGLAEAGVPMDEALFRAVDRAIYLFHMPLFFFVSGWFFPKVVRRGTVGERLWHMVLRLLYPMVIWTYLFIVVKIVAGGAANDPVSAPDLLRWPLPPYLHLWFLWALFVLQLSGLILRVVLDRWLPLLCLVLACLAFSIATSPLELGWAVRQAVHGAPYFFLAAAMSHWKRWPCSAWCGWGALVVLVGVQIAIVPQIRWDGVAWNLAAVFCVLSVVIIARLRAMARQGWLVYLGRASMTIYLTHTIFAAAARIGLLKAGVTDVRMHLVAGIAAGLFVPLAFGDRRVPLDLRRILGFVSGPMEFTNIPRRLRATSHIERE